MLRFLLGFLATLIFLLIPTTQAFAIYDPLSVPNNKFGIHIISGSSDEIIPAADLANSNNGDWGYITVLIESKDRDHSKWQKNFDLLRQLHLIPIVRLATQPEGENWKIPYDGEEIAWADFLDKLNWPTKNRYVIIYNEPNQGQEWAGSVDAKSYAMVLDKTIDALKKKSDDFFVLNAGLDASAPEKRPSYQDETTYLREMNDAVPGIFDKIDGWVSHSYPNPEYSASPNNSGKISVRTFSFELQKLKELGLKKDLPIFITETGWKHAEGKTYDARFHDVETVASYYETAFKDAWSSSKIVAVTPFLLNYQETPFDHFSFKKMADSSAPKSDKPSDNYYPQYEAIRSLSKISGIPIQENAAQLVGGGVYSSIVSGETYNMSLSFKNTGQSIWNEKVPVKLVIMQGSKELGIENSTLPPGTKVKPNDDYAFPLRLKSPLSGQYKVVFNLFAGDKEFSSNAYEFKTEVKEPVVLQVKANLKWKDQFSGSYLLSMIGVTGQKITQVVLGENGLSPEIEAKYLIPDTVYSFTLDRPFYKKSIVSQKLQSGLNIIDFGQLQPDISSAILNPPQLWKLLPFSNK